MKKLSIEVSFEIDDEKRTFQYTLRHQGDSIYQDELADLLRRTADDLERSGRKKVGSASDDDEES